MGQLFPVFLDLEGQACLVVGGGAVARRKVQGLVACGARVTVVSPAVEPGLQRMAQAGEITWRRRGFEDADLEDVTLVFSCTDQEELNERIAYLCKQKRILVNVVDDPPRCSFVVPSVLRRRSLAVAVSTEGKSPLFARVLREHLERLITPAYGEYVDLLGEARERVKAAFPHDIERRRRVFQALLEVDVLPLLEAGRRQEAKERLEACMSSWLD
ncbi:MAG: bifunctional precorrin-2 dehydrogenase/sirohydrochlorin ferrochelatase [Syntrophomonadaceae bacterium]|jgi:precorrin-2 dehydrogenase/sirohydrochlorin ferrochelatase|nr:bifunctional precorrin-2 dehydrogenase/sirohydrochlorin ferrochelatase [Syntrophomonadaceae bacterium]MDH7498374.1 bifunctional precorrin-2 dehydrogenase/sirohydrochlorin ferrochelatase [Syntrophomonadaceae bacterium]